MRLRGELTPVADITPASREEMFQLMDRYYLNVTRERFQADLAEKQWVIRLLDSATGELHGFSTQMLLELDGPREPIAVIFSGDTIIAPSHWGDIALSHVWGRLALSLLDRVAPRRLFWLLISKGYKTYRFLPVFFHEFYPRYEVPTPEWAAELITVLGRRKFPGAYDAAAGVVRAMPGKDRLRAGVADIAAQRLRDPHVRFFVERNPGHANGDELCCLAPVTRENFTAAAYRVIEAGSSTEQVHGAGANL